MFFRYRLYENKIIHIDAQIQKKFHHKYPKLYQYFYYLKLKLLPIIRREARYANNTYEYNRALRSDSPIYLDNFPVLKQRWSGQYFYKHELKKVDILHLKNIPFILYVFLRHGYIQTRPVKFIISPQRQLEDISTGILQKISRNKFVQENYFEIRNYTDPSDYY